MLLWLSMWNIGDVILNMIIYTKAGNNLPGFSFDALTKGVVMSMTQDYITMAGSLYWLIPTIALLITSGFSIMTVTSLASGMTSAATGSANAVGGDIARGNLSYGNIGVENRGGYKDDWAHVTKKGWNDETTYGSRDMSGAYNKAGIESAAAENFIQKVGVNSAEAAAFNNLMRGFGDTAGFEAAAKGHGQTVEGLAEGVASKNAHAQATAIGLMAEAHGGDFQKGARDLGILMGGKEAGGYEQLEKNAIAAGFGGGAHGIESWAKFETSGHVLTKEMAEMANTNAGFDPQEGPFKEGMKADKFRNDDGKFMVDKATYMDHKGSVEVGGGKITETGAFKNREEALAEADRLERDGHTVAGLGLRRLAGSIKPDEAISFKREKSMGGGDISASYGHGTEVNHYDISKDKSGQDISRGDKIALNNISDNEAKMLNKVNEEKGLKTHYQAGDNIMMEADKNAVTYDKLGHLASIDSSKVSNISGKAGAVAERKDLTSQRTGMDKQELDVKQKRAARGAQVEVGNDLMYAVMDNRPEILANGYRSYLSGQGPTTEGRVLVDSMAKTVGGYGSIKQALQDSVTVSGGAGVSWNGGALGKIVEDITGVKLNARGGVEIAKQALEKIDADTLRLGFQKHYNEISRNGNEDTKAKELTQLGHDMYQLIENYGAKSTPEQMLSGTPNPLKDQKDTRIKPEQTTKSTEGVEGDMLGMPYSEKAEPKNRK